MRRTDFAHSRSLLALVMVCAGVQAALVRADWQDSFETPQTSWRLGERDTPTLRVLEHERVYRQARSGQGCEYIHLSCDHGTKVHLELRVPPGPLIEELTVSVWVKSNRPHIHMLASILLPRAMDPRTNKPRRVLLRGSSYDEVGQWQRLTLAEPLRELERQRTSLSYEYGPDLDIREAQLESVILNAYGGPGETKLWIDDVELDSHVILNSIPGMAVDFAQHALGEVQMNGSHFVVEERPMFLRIIEHNGEPLAWLQQLGFNAVLLAQPPTKADIEQARQNGMWLIAPPPLDPAEAQTLGQSEILAWDLGQRIGGEMLESVRRAAAQVRSPEAQLPLVTCAPLQSTSAYARSTDFLILDLPGAGSTHELAGFTQRMLSRVDRAAFSGPFVAAMDTQPPQCLRWQWQAMGFPEGESVSLESEQLRFMAVSAIGSGARGILFRSTVRLDTDAPVARLRAAVLELINMDLKLIEAWISGGQCVGRVNLEDPRVVGYSWEERLAQLLVVCRTSAEQQHAIGGYVDEPLAIVAPNASTSIRAYGLTIGGAQPLRTQRVAGGLRVELEHVGPIAMIVLTNETVVVDHVSQLMSDMRERRIALQQDILRLTLDNTEEVQQFLSRSEDRAARQHIIDATSHLQRASQFAAQNDFRAFESFVDSAANALATHRKRAWETAARRFSSPAASPCCAMYGSLAFHSQLANRLRGRTWSGNAMAAGDMEDMQQLLASGWKRTTDPAYQQVCDAQLSFDTPHAGRSSLLMTLTPPSSSSYRPASDDSPLVISSPGIPVRAGQLVQIRGWVRASPSDAASTSVLHIYDSIAGETLAEVVDKADTWREWTLYRAPLADCQLVINFALTGPGSVWIDDVSVQYVDLR